jgi:hypothetical protein
MYARIVIALITASCLHLASMPNAPLHRQQSMPTLAQYCLPDEHNLDRLFCRE